MKLLICTQKVDMNDPILGFFHRWIEEFSKNVEKITIICLEEGEHNLPGNVRVLSLGKENGVSKVGRVYRFYKYIWRERAQYSHVFVHMNQVYVILGGLLWRALGKKISLWYVHRQTSITLWLAEKIVDRVFTASSQSFSIKSHKVQVVGHGIDLDNYSALTKNKGDVINILHVGRISRIKDILTLIKAGQILSQKWEKRFKIVFVGSPVTRDDRVYLKEVSKYIEENNIQDIFEFTGNVPNKDIKDFYAKADLTINMTPTGGMDKAVLESMASSVVVMSSNESFLEHFGKYDSVLRFSFGDPQDLSEKIIYLFENVNFEALEVYLRNKVEEKSSLTKLIRKIVNIMEN